MFFQPARCIDPKVNPLETSSAVSSVIKFKMVSTMIGTASHEPERDVLIYRPGKDSSQELVFQVNRLPESKFGINFDSQVFDSTQQAQFVTAILASTADGLGEVFPTANLIPRAVKLTTIYGHVTADKVGEAGGFSVTLTNGGYVASYYFNAECRLMAQRAGANQAEGEAPSPVKLLHTFNQLSLRIFPN